MAQAAPAATTPPTESLADTLGLTHPTAVVIADLPPEARRTAALAAAADRRTDLATYRQLYAEAYGHRLDPARHEARDELLVALETLATA